MEPTTDSNRAFQLVDGDKDVLLIEEDSFTVSKFKEIMKMEIAGKFNRLYNTNSNTPISSLFTQISIGSTTLALDHMSWVSLRDIELLKIGSKGWQKGKIRIQVSYKNYDNIQVHLEFSPDEPPQPESPLDDLRQLPEYKQQL